MVTPDAGPDEPIHKEEDDGGEQRQQDVDIKREKRAPTHYVPDHAKKIADDLIEAFHNIFNDDGAKFEQKDYSGKWWR